MHGLVLCRCQATRGQQRAMDYKVPAVTEKIQVVLSWFPKRPPTVLLPNLPPPKSVRAAERMVERS